MGTLPDRTGKISLKGLISEIRVCFGGNKMRYIRNLLGIAFVLLTFLFTSCQPKPDFEVLKGELTELHDEFIEAHLNRDIDFFTRDISDDYFSIGNAEIRRPTKEDIKEQFTDYLNNTTFSEYRYLRDPEMGFSLDGTMAWMVEKIKVRGTRTLDDGTAREMDFICAWITIYERKGGKWIRRGEVSSFERN
jgi:hypothetical protein